MLARMPETPPVDAVTSDARHQDARAAVFAVVPQQRASLGKRLFWRFVLFIAQFRWGLRLLKRLRGS
jgi:hypothetical protein